MKPVPELHLALGQLSKQLESLQNTVQTLMRFGESSSAADESGDTVMRVQYLALEAAIHDRASRTLLVKPKASLYSEISWGAARSAGSDAQALEGIDSDSGASCANGRPERSGHRA